MIAELCAIEKIPIEEHLVQAIISDLGTEADGNFDGYMDDLAKKAKAIVKDIKA